MKLKCPRAEQHPTQFLHAGSCSDHAATIWLKLKTCQEPVDATPVARCAADLALKGNHSCQNPQDTEDTRIATRAPTKVQAPSGAVRCGHAVHHHVSRPESAPWS